MWPKKESNNYDIDQVVILLTRNPTCSNLLACLQRPLNSICIICLRLKCNWIRWPSRRAKWFMLNVLCSLSFCRSLSLCRSFSGHKLNATNETLYIITKTAAYRQKNRIRHQGSPTKKTVYDESGRAKKNAADWLPSHHHSISRNPSTTFSWNKKPEVEQKQKDTLSASWIS